MNTLKIIICLFACCFLYSCNKGGLVDESMSDSYFYSNDKSKIYYKNVKSLDFSKSWNYEWEEVHADAKSFRVMKGGFGKDSKHIFFGSKIIKNVDYATFRKVEDSDNFIDKNNVFSRWLEIIEDANPATFQIIKSVAVYYGDFPKYFWSKDDKHFFYENKKVIVDYNSFTILTRNIMADKNSIYALEFDEFIKYPNENDTEDKFVVIDDHIVHTSNYFYFHHLFTDSIKGISKIPIKDAKSIKKYCFRDYFSIDGNIYYNARRIENVDFKTFETFDKENAVRFAKDKNNFFVGDKIIPNINPEEVKFDAKNNKISYRGKFWNWQTEAFDIVEKNN